MPNQKEMPFTKMTGAGNDFILIDLRTTPGSFDWAKLAPRLCDRRYGIGADGLLILDGSTKAEFRMEYYNADGSYGGMCGNGGRCVARYVLDEGGRAEVSFEALDHVYTASAARNEIRLRMKPPKHYRHGHLRAFDATIFFHYLDTGTAHCVLFMDELDGTIKERIDREGIIGLGRLIRNDAEFAPGGTNVDFITLTGKDSLAMRTYERGVEDETLACGTGAVASAVVAHLAQGKLSPVRVTTRSGEILTVEFTSSGGDISNVVLIGSAVKVFCGVVEIPT